MRTARSVDEGIHEMSMERKTAGEIEAALSVAVSRVMKEMHGSGARTIRTHLVDDMVLVVLLDVFSVAQRRLACVGIDDDGTRRVAPDRCHDPDHVG